MADRKIRTREHVIATMSVHHVGYIVAKAGYVLDVPSVDYGLDGHITTFDETGAIESEFILVQFKATNRINILPNGVISFTVSVKDVNFWISNFFPVVLIVFDANRERGYYLVVQEHFRTNPLTAAHRVQQSVTVRIDGAAVVSESAVRSWRDLKNGYRKART